MSLSPKLISAVVVKPAKVGLAEVATLWPIAMSLALTVTPVPAPTFNVTSPEDPPPVKPEPAVTPVISPVVGV